MEGDTERRLKRRSLRKIDALICKMTESESDSSTDTIRSSKLQKVNDGEEMGPPKLAEVARKASASAKPGVADGSNSRFRNHVASTSWFSSADDMDELEAQQVESVVRVPVVFSDVSDITAAEAIEAIRDLNAFVIEEFSGGQAQELNRRTSRVTGMMMRLLMSNIELSGKMKKEVDGSIKIPAAEARRRSRSKLKQQGMQKPQLQNARSKSRSVVRAMSRPRPLTFSAIIKGATPLPTATIKTMVMEQGTNARVKSVREHKEGGVLIETCSVQELEELIENAKRQDGLVAEKHVPKVLRRLVLEDVSKDENVNELMVKLYEKNVAKEEMTYEQFNNTTKVVSVPTADRKSLVLEVEEIIQTRWLKQKRVYVDWSSYFVRPFREQKSLSCFKCYGLGHTSRACKETASLCKRCGESGHQAVSCARAICCRNCKAKNLDANHSVTSVTLCPLYKNFAQMRPKNNKNNTHRNAE